MRSLFPIVNNDNFLFPEDVWNTFFTDVTRTASPLSMPKIDLEDKGDRYELTVDLPGMTKDDIELTYDDPILVVTASHKDEQQSDEAKKYVYRERTARTFSRRLLIPHIDRKSTEASFEDGVLKVSLPKEKDEPEEKKNIIHIK